MLTKFILTLLIPQLALSGGWSNNNKIHSADNLQGLRKINPYAIEPIISAGAAAVIDAKSERVLYKKNHDKKLPIASITKLMTVYAYLKKTNNDLSQTITLEKEDEVEGGMRSVFRGEKGTVLDFIHLALIGSDNSAASLLARSGGFKENFQEETNKILQSFDLKNTHFDEETGLNANNVSTALDLAKLAKNIFSEEKFIAEITQKQEYAFIPQNTGVKRKVLSTNELLPTSLFAIIGGKTGHTEAAGYCLVIKVANKNGKEIIIAILNAPTSSDRFQDAKSLAWWVFENFE